MAFQMEVLDSNGKEILPNSLVWFKSKGEEVSGVVRYVKCIRNNGADSLSICVESKTRRYPIVFHKASSLTVFQ